MNGSFVRACLAATLAFATVLASASPADASGRGNRVFIRDECDPATFNAAPPVGPGLGVICTGNGEVTFSEFVAELRADRTIDEWAFDPDELKVKAGRSIVVKNVGGETHTFTRVARFGPGFVPFLNDLVFGPGSVPIPEFRPPFGPGINFVASGGTLTLPNAATPLVLGKNRFECGIHPWMRTVITVEPADKGDD